MAAVGVRCLYREAALATIAVSSGGGSLGDYYWEPGEKETGSPVRAILTEHYSLHYRLHATPRLQSTTTTTTTTRIITNISFYI